jgi:hypothetical protein
MKKISSSPDRHSVQLENYIKRCKENGEEPREDYCDIYRNAWKSAKENEQDSEWQKDNLEYDLRTTDWIIEKVRKSHTYAQNLYAALCNNSFQKKDPWLILKEQRWSCSWRYAGGIIADMREQGDYLDWYCSGRKLMDYDGYDEIYDNMTKSQLEGDVTEEIERDLDRLGWTVIKYMGDKL